MVRRSAGLWIAVAVLLVACTETGDAEIDDGTPHPTATPAETRPPAVPPEAVPDGYRLLFESVILAVEDAVRRLNHAVLAAAGEEDTRALAEGDVRLAIDDLERELHRVTRAESVPPLVEPAHAELELALRTYLDAARLLLPGGRGGPVTFDPTGFQETMREAAETLNRARARVMPG